MAVQEKCPREDQMNDTGYERREKTYSTVTIRMCFSGVVTFQMLFEYGTVEGRGSRGKWKVVDSGGMMGVRGMEQRSIECLAIGESSILDGSYNFL